MNEVATQKASPPIVKFKSDIGRLIEAKELALPSNVTPEAFRNAAIVAVQDNPQILSCSAETVFRSIRKLAAAGLIPDGREAALVPFKGSCTAMPMVFGLIKMARRSGDVRDIRAHTVYQGEVDQGRFDYIVGDEERLEHKPILFGDRGEAIAYYAIARLKDGTIVRTFMSREEVEKIRRMAASQRGEKMPQGIWKDHYEQMAHKTVIRRLCKRLDLSAEDMRHITMDDETRELRDVTPEPEERAPRKNLAQMIMEPEDEPLEGEVVTDDGYPGSPKWDEGATAFEGGKKVSDCPYKEGDDLADWLSGYNAAKKAAEE